MQYASIIAELNMKQQKKRSDCPVSCSLEIWGDKWSLLIIRDMMFAGKSTYGDFLKSPEAISTNILASRLQDLEATGIIKKMDHPDSKAKVMYKLTQKGIDLLPVIVEIQLWADVYMDLSPEVKTIMQEIKTNKEDFIKKKKDELRIIHLNS